MKEKITHFTRIFLLSISFILYTCIIYSQEPDPASWNNFVYGKGNLIIRDTFKLQTFNDDPGDNWKYTTSGDAVIFDATLAGIKNSSKGMSLKLPIGSELVMEDYLPEIYQEIFINFPYAAKTVMVGENLVVNAKRTEVNSLIDYKLVEPKKEFSVDYRAKRDDNKQEAWVQITGGPMNVSLNIRTGKNTKNGFYAVDSLYAVGKIPVYTLFKGQGNWSDKTLWSHLPAARYRKALINGDVTIDSNINCHDLFIGNGSVSIQPDNSLTIHNLTICDSDIAIKSSGTLTIKEKVSIHKTFEEKGKWHFISFPFNIYTDNIDPSFKLGDDTTKEDGNFFYIRKYNGNKRANSGSATDNWEVVSIQSVYEDNNLLFERGKGYLIALDSKADKETLSFSIEAKDIPVDFEKKASIAISVGSNGKEEHQGWFLCGNPLPAPLHLSEITKNPLLDGNIYIYDGTSYKAYSLESDHVIPPFSAFFVKSEESSQLVINPSSALRSSPFLRSPSLNSLTIEPEIMTPSSSYSIWKDEMPTSYIDGGQLYITDLPAPGKITLIDISGRLVYYQSVPSGSTIIPLLLKTGTYILQIEVNNHSTQHKFIWNK